ncbi:MAG: hypothetical protein RMA76_36985 [Deltaproteobacteria bacterium]
MFESAALLRSTALRAPSFTSPAKRRPRDASLRGDGALPCVEAPLAA